MLRLMTTGNDVTTRSGRSRAAILRAAYDLIGEFPYSEITIEKIAAQAGVGKPTIYRRWPSKGPLLLDAFIEYIYPPVPVATGEFGADVRTWLHRLVDFLANPATGRITAELVGAMQVDRDLADAWDERLFQPIRADNLALVRAAQQSGQLRDGPPDLLVDMLVGPIWFRMLISRQPLTHDQLDEMMDLALTRIAA
jgi:AcrR family transcriptional regulator